jgi:DNA polymerase-3 subunit delta'
MDSFVKMQYKFATQINNAKRLAKFPHAILIEGDSKPLLDDAIKYTITSLMCQNNPTCFECENCVRAFSGQNADVVEFDLSIEDVKIEKIREIKKRFSNTALEATNVQVYVIKHIEKASSLVMNTLLKFLEEPPANVYAIFTTHNSDKVIQTILSRTLIYRLAHNDVEQIRSALLEQYDERDVDFVFSISNDEAVISNALQSKSFKLFKESANQIFKSIYVGNFYLITYEMLNEFEKDELGTFFELFYTCLAKNEFLEDLKVDLNIIEKIKKAEYLDVALDAALSARINLNTNMNKALVVDKFSIEVEGALV